MNAERLGQWVSIFANVGVFIGFLLIAYQIQQNNVSLTTASTHKTSELFANSEMSLMGDTGYAALAKALDEPGEISREELMQVWSYMSLANYSATQVYEDYRRGVVSTERWLYVREIYISYINHPIGLIWWESQLPLYQDPESQSYFAEIQTGLSETPRNATLHQFQLMLKKVRELKEDVQPDA